MVGELDAQQRRAAAAVVRGGADRRGDGGPRHDAALRQPGVLRRCSAAAPASCSGAHSSTSSIRTRSSARSRSASGCSPAQLGSRGGALRAAGRQHRLGRARADADRRRPRAPAVLPLARRRHHASASAPPSSSARGPSARRRSPTSAAPRSRRRTSRSCSSQRSRIAGELLDCDLSGDPAPTARGDLLLVSGHGYTPQEIGRERALRGPRSFGAATSIADEPLRSSDWRREQRYVVPPVLVRHGIASSISAPIAGWGGPWGVIALSLARQRTFTRQEIGFLRSVAHILASAVGRLAGRGRDAPPRDARPAHRARQPTLFLERLEAALQRPGRARGRPVVRPRRVQDRQRLARAPRRRRGAVALGERLERVVRAGDTSRGWAATSSSCCSSTSASRTRRSRSPSGSRTHGPSRSRRSDGTIFLRLRRRALSTHRTESATTLLEQADAAMYRAKERGRGGVSCSTSRCASRRSSGSSSERDLRMALDRGELWVAYQPIVDLQDDERPVFLEALLRWHHPSRGSVPPAEFIPVAEQSGLITELGGFVVRRACADVARCATTRPARLRRVGQPLGARGDRARLRRRAARGARGQRAAARRRSPSRSPRAS